MPSAYLAVWSPHSPQTIPLGSGCLLDPHSPAVSPTAPSTDTFLPLYPPHFACCSTLISLLFPTSHSLPPGACDELSPLSGMFPQDTHMAHRLHPSKLCSCHLFITSHPEFKAATSPCFPASASSSLQQSAPSSTGSNDLLIHYASCLSLLVECKLPRAASLVPFVC